MESAIALIQAILPSLAGPGAAVLILLLVLFGIGYLLVKFAVPMIEAHLKQSQDNLEKIMAEHKEDRNAFLKGISSVNKRLDHIDDRLTDIEEKMC